MKTTLLSMMLAMTCVNAADLPVPTSGNVTLPIEDYNHLTDLATHPARRPDGVPFPYVLRSAQLNLRVGAESVTGAVNLEGDVLTTGDRKVPLVNGMIVEDAEQQGKDLPLEHEGNFHSAVLSGPGEFAVTLHAALPLTIETGRASFILPAPAAGFARLSLTVPGEQTQINLSPGIVTSRTSQNGQTVIEATLVPGQNTNLWWASRLNSPVAPAAPREVRLLSDVHTLISATEADLVIAALVQVTVVQGEPTEFRLTAPTGYELTGATGANLSSSEMQGSTVLLRVANAALRSHEFLVTMVKSNANVTKTEVPLVTLSGAQRETGEVLVESDGAMELNAAEQGGLRRMDLKELSPSLRALSRGTLQAAFRYQKRPTEAPGLALDWVRFSDSHVLSAVAQRAEVTTLVTVEGRSLSEIKLMVRNQSQPFLKVQLPTGATILSAEVAGEKVKPVLGSDGSRVPLLRPGFASAGAYEVSFVILNAESPLARRGDAGLALPKMDLPIGEVSWEVFLPQQLTVSNFGGDVRPAKLFPVAENDVKFTAVSYDGTVRDQMKKVGGLVSSSRVPSVLAGVVLDAAGAVVVGAQVSVTAGGQTFSAISGPDGRWALGNIPTGNVRVSVQSPGFQASTLNIFHNNPSGTLVSNVLTVGSVTETVEVNSRVNSLKSLPQAPREIQVQQEQAKDTAASANVGELQRKVVGVLPININIPRTGISYRFVRPLVVDEETKLTFRYRMK